MLNENMYKLVLLFPIACIAYFVISIILYRNRHKILEHYNNSFGYISSFIFAAFMAMPITVGLPMYLFSEYGIMAIFTVIYCIPAFIWYIRKLIKSKRGARLGLFITMLFMGLSAPVFVLYKKIVEPPPMDSDGDGISSGGGGFTSTDVRITDYTGDTVGYYDSETGRITDASGNTMGYFNQETGRMTDSTGNTTGYHNRETGHITNSTGNTTGYHDQGTGRITNSMGNTSGYSKKN